jgi:hypothetical protein
MHEQAVCELNERHQHAFKTSGLKTLSILPPYSSRAGILRMHWRMKQTTMAACNSTPSKPAATAFFSTIFKIRNCSLNISNCHFLWCNSVNPLAT